MSASPEGSQLTAAYRLIGKYSWLIAGIIALIIFLTTLQVTINGSDNTYTIDVGEIQNALPRWGTIHFPGYPLYSLTGSTFVTLLRFAGIEPAAGASLLSAFWGAIAIALLVVLQLSYSVRPIMAILTSILFALSTSFWVDASIAEVHTLTIVLYLGTILFAVRFSRTGGKTDLIWLTFFASQAVLHQRAMAFLIFGLLILLSGRLKELTRMWPYVLGISIAGALVYLYLPIRAWQGAEWTFSQPGTWRGFWSIVFDTKADRIISSPQTIGEWGERAKAVMSVFQNEWPILVILSGLIGSVLGSIQKNKHEALGIFFLWFPFVVLSFFIWVGRIADALLAVNLPVIAMAAFGLGLLSTIILERSAVLGVALAGIWLILAAYLFVDNRAGILAITRDTRAESFILQAEEFKKENYSDDETTLMALWGHDYWSLAYAQEYQDRLGALTLVDHNADLGSIMDSSEHLITLERTFYLRPLTWWDQQFGQVFLSSVSPNLVEIDTSPIYGGSGLTLNQDFSLGNGVKVRRTDLSWESVDRLVLTVYWEASQKIESDFSVAVHLVSRTEPEGPEDIVAQSDRQHPVSGWYPTGRWSVGEIVRDEYLVDIPEDSKPAAIRVSMYQQDVDGSYNNTEWLTIPIDFETRPMN